MSKKDSSSTVKKFAIGAFIAALAGYLTGILTAPKSGKETRQDIKDTAQRTVAEAEKQLKRAHTELNDLLDQAKQKTADLKAGASKEIDQMLDNAKDAKEKLREVLSAVHEGGAEDKDLDKALDEASKAIKHLRDYLKK